MDNENIGEFGRTEKREARIRRVLAARQPDLTVVLENIHDPHNAFAILRSADAIGVHEVQLIYNECEYPGYKGGKKTSAGTKKWIERNMFETVKDCYASLRNRGFKIYVSRLDPNAKSIYDLDLTEPVALLMGNEHDGATDEACDLADSTYFIPMVGMVQSLNVSVACAVSLYEAFRQRRAKGMYDEKSFSDDEYERLVGEWLMK